MAVAGCWSPRSSFLASFVTATWPIAGKTPQQWLPVLVRFETAIAHGERRSAPVTRGGPLSQRPKPPFADLSLQALSGPSGEIGVLLDRRNSTASAILDVAGTPFALADQAARQQLIDSWTGFLESTAQQSGSLVRLAWIERVVPDQALSLRVDAEHAFASPGTEAMDQARSSCLALLASGLPGAAVRHDSYVVATVRVARAHDWASPLAETVPLIASRCREIGLGSGALLSAGGVRTYLRHQFSAGLVVDTATGIFPLGVEEGWGDLRTDASWHATYWVAEWPRTEVGCDFLLPLLIQPQLRRTVAVVMEPLPPAGGQGCRTDTDVERRGRNVAAPARLRHHRAMRESTKLPPGGRPSWPPDTVPSASRGSSRSPPPPAISCSVTVNEWSKRRRPRTSTCAGSSVHSGWRSRTCCRSAAACEAAVARGDDRPARSPLPGG